MENSHFDFFYFFGFLKFFSIFSKSLASDAQTNLHIENHQLPTNSAKILLDFRIRG